MYLLTDFVRPDKASRLAGFTLIELLVVVLIIGILAAVALPQYQRAVARSRAAEAVLGMGVLSQGMDRYYMANGTYTAQMSDLDVQVGDTAHYTYRLAPDDGDGVPRIYITPKTSDLPSFQYSFSAPRYRWCFAPVGDEAANAVCKTYGPFDHTYDGKTNYYKM